jgi:hypothetical protein
MDYGQGQMKKEILVAEAPIIIGEVTLTLLVKQSIAWFNIKGVLSFSVRKQPVYAVLSCRGSSKVLDMLGQEISMNQVKLECPGLDVVP